MRTRSNLGAVTLRGKPCIALYEKSIADLRSVACHMGSHCVTCHPTQVNAPGLATPEGWKAELTWMSVIYRDGLPVRRQSPIEVVTKW